MQHAEEFEEVKAKAVKAFTEYAYTINSLSYNDMSDFNNRMLLLENI